MLSKNWLLLSCLVVFISTLKGQNHALASCSIELTKQSVVYDPTYFSIDYPMGDVPSDRGVCSDVVIRAYRLLGVDLQQEVHEDMKSNFDLYPKIWDLSSCDTNIDHRRVPNLLTFFTRNAQSRVISQKAIDYKPGDLVIWQLPRGRMHIGIVSNVATLDKARFMMVHNIGAGQLLEDCLFDYPIIGHFVYMP